MFEALEEGLKSAIRTLRGKGKLSEANMRDGMKLVERALLEADVSYPVVKDFVADVTEEAVGERVLKSIDPDVQVFGVVHRELDQADGPGRSFAASQARHDGAHAVRPARLRQNDHLRQARPDDQGARQAADARRRRLAASGRHPAVARARRAAWHPGLFRAGGDRPGAGLQQRGAKSSRRRRFRSSSSTPPAGCTSTKS